MTTILIVGNVVDGLSFIGPFLDSEEAAEYAEKNFGDDDWVSTKLENPCDCIVCKPGVRH